MQRLHYRTLRTKPFFEGGRHPASRKLAFETQYCRFLKEAPQELYFG